MNRTNILIVNDLSTKGLDLESRLPLVGYHVVATVNSAEEAIDQIACFRPDLVLMDVQIKGSMNYIQAGDTIQSTYDVPVIFTSAQSDITISRSKTTEPFGYIFKPYDDKHIIATIEVALLRHKFEKQLRDSKQWLDTILSSIQDGVIAVDKQGIVRFMNLVAEELTGWMECDAKGKNLFEVFVLSDTDTGKIIGFSSLQELLLFAEDRSGFQTFLVNKDGKKVPVETKVSPIKKGNETVLGMVLAFRDVTERLRAMEDVRRQASRAETLVKVSEQLNSRLEFNELLDIVCATANQILKTSSAMVFLFDAKANLFIEMARCLKDDTLIAKNDPTRIKFDQGVLDAFLPADNSVFTIIDLITHHDIRYDQFLQSLKICSLVIAPLVRNNIVFGYLICGSTDNERSYSKDDLDLLKGLANQVSIAISNANLFEQLRNGRERQQFLARQLVKVQEGERRSLSLELHDEIGQMLTGLQFSVKSAMLNSSEEQKNKLDQVQTLVSEIISQVRELSINLRPSLLDDLGILPTLTWHFDRFEAKTGIHVHFEHQNLDRRFFPELEITVFRIVQEALTNVARYSKAARADVKIIVSESVMQVSISDQGCGFDASVLSKNQSMGIEGMRERAYSIGGLLEIQSEPGKGTRILARLPVSGQLERRHDDRNYSSGR